MCTLVTLLAAVPAHAQQSTLNGHYLVELDDSATAIDDVDSVALQLARTYGGSLELYAAAGFHGFAISITAEKARLLASDPRVKSVRESITTLPRKAPEPRPAIVAAPNDAPASTITIGPYKYDAGGNVIHMGPDRYTYDRMSRVVSGTANTAQNTDTQNFTYDGFGNLNRIEIPSKSALYIDVDPANNKLKSSPGTGGGTTASHTWAAGNDAYDAAGNQRVVNDRAYVYEFDSLNALKAMTSPRHELYIYDADGERVATVTYSDALNATWRYTMRDTGGRVLREVADSFAGGAHSWRLTKDYVYRSGSLLATITPQAGGTEARTHFHLNHLGTPTLITDDAGQRVALHKYWPFGEEAPGSDADGERMKFTGHERDVAGSDVNALDYMHARFFRPVAGRFLSLDSIQDSRAVSSVESWNRYVYGLDNPLKFIDPDGRAIKMTVKDTPTGSKIDITITMEFSGRGGTVPRGPAVRAWIAMAERVFNFNGPHVQSTLHIDAKLSADGNTDPSRHQVIIDPARTRSQTPLGGDHIDLSSTADPFEFTHEVAHTLGMDDKYTDPCPGCTSIPNPGYQNNLLGSVTGGTDLFESQFQEMMWLWNSGQLNQGVVDPEPANCPKGDTCDPEKQH